MTTDTPPAAAQATASRAPRLRRLSLSDPLRWLAAGWRDFVRAPWIGLFFGTVFVAMGWALMKVFERAPAWTLALSAGFLLMGPFLCLGLYRASQILEAGGRPDLGECMLAWEARTGQLAIFGFVLLVLEMLWGRVTLVIFAVTFRGMPDFKGSLAALADPANMTFTIAWLVVGAIFASIIYAITVVSMPMILDQPDRRHHRGPDEHPPCVVAADGDDRVGHADRADRLRVDAAVVRGAADHRALGRPRELARVSSGCGCFALACRCRRGLTPGIDEWTDR